MKPEIIQSSPLRLVGLKSEMSFIANTTPMLWGKFMPWFKQQSIPPDTNKYSVEVYPDVDFFKTFNPERKFEKWAAIEWKPDINYPEHFESLDIPAGRYAVFNYRGGAENAAPFYRSIFTEWLPAEMLILDHRPHFAVMGEKYQHGSPESEEEIWIPVR